MLRNENCPQRRQCLAKNIMLMPTQTGVLALHLRLAYRLCFSSISCSNVAKFQFNRIDITTMCGSVLRTSFLDVLVDVCVATSWNVAASANCSRLYNLLFQSLLDKIQELVVVIQKCLLELCGCRMLSAGRRMPAYLLTKGHPTCLRYSLIYTLDFHHHRG